MPPKRGSIREAYDRYEPQGRQSIHRKPDHDPLTSRHERGYDPLDVAMREARREYARVAKAAAPAGSSSAERRSRALAVMRGLLHEHLVVMHEHGLVFEHTFTGKTLGFSIALAKYGDEGRVFVQVERTRPSCELFPDALLPSDELIAINGDLVIDPTLADFDAIRDKIASRRPVKLLFVKGELRKAAFEAQERSTAAAAPGWFSPIRGAPSAASEKSMFDFDAQFWVCCAPVPND